LLGTHTSGQGREYLQIATLQLPKNESDAAERDVLSRDQYDDDKGGELRWYPIITRLTTAFSARDWLIQHLVSPRTIPDYSEDQP
jgi:hypothetical protein